MLNLVIFYHCMTLTVPSWCNLKCKCSINIIHTLHSVFRHTEDMHLLLWTVLTNVFLDFLHVELVFFFFYHYITWAIPSMCNLKLKNCSINIIQTLQCVYTY
jgi:hypothetical protein